MGDRARWGGQQTELARWVARARRLRRGTRGGRGGSVAIVQQQAGGRQTGASNRGGWSNAAAGRCSIMMLECKRGNACTNDGRFGFDGDVHRP